MEAESAVSRDVLARYAADAARDVAGVAGLAERSQGRGRPVAVSGDEDTLAIAIVLALEWGRSAAEVAAEVQRRVSDYLARMANVTPASVDVVFDTVSTPPARR